MSLASESKFLIQKFIQKPFYLNSLVPIAPFRLFKPSITLNQSPKNKVCLPLNRFNDPYSLFASSSHISLWSESHLQFAKLLKRHSPQKMDKLILKNPYKTQKMIHSCIQLGLKTMLVDSFEELSKIHQQFLDLLRCRCLLKTQNSDYVPINFVWNVSDPENDIKQIETLKSYNIKLAGLHFDEFQTAKPSQVRRFLEKTNYGLSEKKKVRSVYLQAQSETFESTIEIYQKDDYFRKNKIETVVEKRDFKMNDKYWIAARVIGQNRRKEVIVNEEAYHYLSAEHVKKGTIFEQKGKKWILSTISHFPEMSIMQEHLNKGYIMEMK